MLFADGLGRGGEEVLHHAHHPCTVAALAGEGGAGAAAAGGTASSVIKAQKFSCPKELVGPRASTAMGDRLCKDLAISLDPSILADMALVGCTANQQQQQQNRHFPWQMVFSSKRMGCASL